MISGGSERMDSAGWFTVGRNWTSGDLLVNPGNPAYVANSYIEDIIYSFLNLRFAVNGKFDLGTKSAWLLW
jgi:hypothetical protein